MSFDYISILSRFLIRELNVLNVCEINILQHLLVMFKVKRNMIPRVLN